MTAPTALPDFSEDTPWESLPTAFNVRRVSEGTLSELLQSCEPGGLRHTALLRERRRRREVRDRMRRMEE